MANARSAAIAAPPPRAMDRIDVRLSATPIVEAPSWTRFAMAVVVTANDGTVLHCMPHPTDGILAPAQWRWRLVDRSGNEYVGPAVNDDPALSPLPGRIAAWWDAWKELARRQCPSQYEAAIRHRLPHCARPQKGARHLSAIPNACESPSASTGLGMTG
jgi:hypothetical protein